MWFSKLQGMLGCQMLVQFVIMWWMFENCYLLGFQLLQHRNAMSLDYVIQTLAKYFLMVESWTSQFFYSEQVLFPHSHQMVKLDVTFYLDAF